MLASAVDGIRMHLPARVQKATVERDGALILEVYVHVRGSVPEADSGGAGTDKPGAKRWIVVEGATLSWLDARPARAEAPEGARAAEPPAAQGLARKEVVPSVLAALEPVDEAGLILRFTFARPEGHPRVLIVEQTADPRAVLCAETEDGLRILGILGVARPTTAALDGRDLRRGRLYEAPRAPAAPIARDASTALRKPAPVVDRALAETRAALRAEARRLRRLVDALEADLERHGEAARHEEAGELLKTTLGTIKRGMSSVEVTDWSGEPRTLALDPLLDAKGNLASLFKRARRSREAASRAAPRLDEARLRLATLEEVRARLAPASPPASVVDEARAFLARPESGGSARRKAARAGKRQPWRAFRVANDVVVRVGRGARDNDALVKSARGNDLWLHARGHHGAHLIIPSSGAEVHPDVLLDSAHLAAHFSSARGERHVDVQTARVKHLKKPGPGAPAGLIHVAHEVVVHLRVDEERVKRLLDAEVPA